MRRPVWISLAVGMACSPVAEAPRAPRNPWAQVEAIASSEVDNHALVGMAIGVAYRGKVVLTKGFGFEDREAHVPVDPRTTLFRWASVSKTMTAVIAADLAHDKRLDLDAPIDGYAPTAFVARCSGRVLEHARGTFPCVDGLATIPLSAEEQHGVTPRRIGGHLAGIPHYGNGRGTPNPPDEFISDYRRNTGIESALPFLTSKPLVAIPGSRFEYSTFGFNLLGAALEKASGTSFGELVENVNGKAGTHVAVDREVAPATHRAVGYLMKDGRIERQGSTDVAWKAPGGGLISSVFDFTRYCAALDGNALLSNEDKSLLWTSQKDASGKDTQYGFGFEVNSSDGERHIAHDGAQEKTRTSLSYFPDRRLCVVIMTNAEYAEIESIAAALDRAALAAP